MVGGSEILIRVSDILSSEELGTCRPRCKRNLRPVHLGIPGTLLKRQWPFESLDSGDN